MRVVIPSSKIDINLPSTFVNLRVKENHIGPAVSEILCYNQKKKLSTYIIGYFIFRKAEVQDTGVYYCRGVNGFGTAQIQVDLIVIGKKK